MSEVTLHDLIVWDTLKKEIRELQARERGMRVMLAQKCFPVDGLKEGSNRKAFGEYQNGKASLVLDYKIERKVDEAALPAIMEGRPQFAELVRWKPELKVRDYKLLSSEDKLIFDEALVIKPAATPTLKFDFKESK